MTDVFHNNYNFIVEDMWVLLAFLDVYKNSQHSNSSNETDPLGLFPLYGSFCGDIFKIYK